MLNKQNKTSIDHMGFPLFCSKWFRAIVLICTDEQWFEMALRLLPSRSQIRYSNGTHNVFTMARHVHSISERFGRTEAVGQWWVSTIFVGGIQPRRSGTGSQFEIILQRWNKCNQAALRMERRHSFNFHFYFYFCRILCSNDLPNSNCRVYRKITTSICITISSMLGTW